MPGAIPVVDDEVVIAPGSKDRNQLLGAASVSYGGRTINAGRTRGQTLVLPIPGTGGRKSVVDDEMAIAGRGKDIDKLLATTLIHDGSGSVHGRNTRRQTQVGPIPGAIGANSVVDDQVAVVSAGKTVDELVPCPVNIGDCRWLTLYSKGG